MMNRSTTNKLVATGLAGALALAATTPSFARGGEVAAAAVGGFAAGALIGSAAANAHAGYYGYGYAPDYAYVPGYGYDSYAYALGPGVPAYGYSYGDYPVGSKRSGAPIYRSELGPNCTVGLKQQDRC